MALLHVQQFPGVLIGFCPPDLEAPWLLNPSNLVHSAPPLRGWRIAPLEESVKEFVAGLGIGISLSARRPARLVYPAFASIPNLTSGWTAGKKCRPLRTDSWEVGSGYRRDGHLEHESSC